MSLLEGTAFGAAFLLPGVGSLVIALTPRRRSIRPSSISTRAVALVTFAALNWFVAVWGYAKLCSGGKHGANLSQLVFGTEAERTAQLESLLNFPPAVWKFIGLLVLVMLGTGTAWALVQNAAITGSAVREFKLDCRHLTWPRRVWLAVSRSVDSLLGFCHLRSMLEPVGAGYWLVLRAAARLTKPVGGRTPLLYADVMQGSEVVGEQIGKLYCGAVDELLCETDGNIVFVRLKNASRWSSSGSWVRILSSELFIIEGATIRNINFRFWKQVLHEDDDDEGDGSEWPTDDAAPKSAGNVAPPT